MERNRISAAGPRGVRGWHRVVMLLLAGLSAATAAQAQGKAGSAAARAAGPASSSATNPLDLSLPRDAGQWTGVASRVQQQDRLEVGPGVPQERTLTLRPRQQPYGTGFEARMSRDSQGGAFGAATSGPGMAGPGAQDGAGQGAAPRGGGGKGR